MKNRIRFISHQGKKILLVDCTNCSAEELEKFADLVPACVTAEPRGTVLLLADFTGSKVDKKAVERVKPALVFDRPHIKRSAWVGTDSLPKILYEHMKSFSQRELPRSRPARKLWIGWSRTERGEGETPSGRRRYKFSFSTST